jgi:cell wall-associated NlpC family hydrolase
VLIVAAQHAGRHRKDRSRRASRARNAAVATSAAAIAGIAVTSPPHPAPAPAVPAVHAVLASSSETLGQRMLDQAETRTGDWYAWGGTGPSVFDCSGLVYWAAERIGLGSSFPRDTYDLEHSSRLEYIPLSQARRGDLMFYGTGHVEFDTIWYHTTFGAQTWGTRVGWHKWSAWWHPTFAMRILR